MHFIKHLAEKKMERGVTSINRRRQNGATVDAGEDVKIINLRTTRTEGRTRNQQGIAKIRVHDKIRKGERISTSSPVQSMDDIAADKSTPPVKKKRTMPGMIRNCPSCNSIRACIASPSGPRLELLGLFSRSFC